MEAPAIEKLDDSIIRRIAAGEVIHQPSNVVKELLENAIDAKARSITISIENGGYTLIRVTDDGCGIAPEALETIFMPFTSYKTTGTGLGLAITQKIIKAHYGDIDISSSPGRGTTFTITLPHL